MSKKPTLVRITPFQFITLLEELAVVGCCEHIEYTDEKRTPGYRLSIFDVYEGDVILSGACRAKNPPPDSIVEALKEAKKHEGPPPALTPKQFIALLDEICLVAPEARLNHADDEQYEFTQDDAVEGIAKLFPRKKSRR